MPDNPFEHNAKQKLDELKLIPPESVWLQVKDQIGRDKRRRRMLIWIPLGCFLLAGSGWFLFSGKSATTDSFTHSSGKKEIVSEAGQPAPGSSGTAGQSPSSQTHKSLGNTNPLGNPHGKAQHAPAREGRTDKRSSEEADKLAEHILDVQALSADGSDNGISDNRKKGSAATTETGLPGSDQAAAVPDTIVSDSSGQHQKTIAKKLTADSLKKIVDKKPEARRRHSIQWGIVAGGGFSSLPGKGNENYPYYSVGNGGSIGGAGGSGGGGGYGYSRPLEKHSSSFYLGLRMQKKLTTTTSLFSGIQYAYASVKIASGNLVNQPAAFYSGSLGLTSVNSYYAVVNNQGYNYRNQYHFLEIPLGIEHQFGQGSRFSFNAGISAAWLFASNALLYDPQSGIYFKHNAYLNKLQWNVLGGIQCRLLRTKAYDLKVGPQVQYGLTGVVNRKMSYTEHRLFGGIQILLSRNEK